MSGFVARAFLVCGVLVAASACGGHASNTGDDDGVDANVPPEPCTTLGCFIVDCATKGLPPTSISGTVYAPNGTLPLFGVNVYVPAADPGPLPEGAQCDRCSTGLLGGSYAQTTTDEMGHFRLDNVPATTDVPIIVQTGKWRRQFKLPVISACQDLPIPDAQTRLPKNKTEGDIPHIAITTGNADALECLPRKLGLDDSEFTSSDGDGRVHLYYGNGTQTFMAQPATGSKELKPALDVWGSVDTLKKYDMTFLSCEGGQGPGNKPQTAIDAMVAYANLGGRVFASHWHNIWIAGDQNNYDNNAGNNGVTNAAWSSLATYDFAAAQNEATQLAIIDEVRNPKGVSFAKWLDFVGATPTHDQITIADPRYIIQTSDPAKTERWVYFDPTLTTPVGKTGTQDFLFTTPVDVAADQRCGKVVFSDMHVSKGSASRNSANANPTPWPSGCSADPLTPQEKALAFIFFDISSCVGPIF